MWEETVSRLPLSNLFNSKPSIEKRRGSLQTQKTSRKDPYCHISMLMRCHSETPLWEVEARQKFSLHFSHFPHLFMLKYSFRFPNTVVAKRRLFLMVQLISLLPGIHTQSPARAKPASPSGLTRWIRSSKGWGELIV